jgi:hypothetical protein
VLKFSGPVAPSSSEVEVDSYLADVGAFGGDPAGNILATSYPLSEPMTLTSFSFNLRTAITGTNVHLSARLVTRVGGMGLPIPVPGFVVPSYISGTANDTGIETVAPAPVTVSAGDTLDLQVRMSGNSTTNPVEASATVRFV